MPRVEVCQWCVKGEDVQFEGGCVHQWKGPLHILSTNWILSISFLTGTNKQCFLVNMVSLNHSTSHFSPPTGWGGL